jgi:hypothetical protein
LKTFERQAMHERKHSTQEEEPSSTANSDKKKTSSLKFGWGKFRPECLQIFNGPKCFLFVLVVFNVSQGKVKYRLINCIFTQSVEMPLFLPKFHDAILRIMYRSR